MKAITEKQLYSIVERINEITNSPQDYKGIGNFHLSFAYGGVSLHRRMNDGGGVYDVFSCGYVPKRELANRMWAFISGFSHAKHNRN